MCVLPILHIHTVCHHCQGSLKKSHWNIHFSHNVYVYNRRGGRRRKIQRKKHLKNAKIFQVVYFSQMGAMSILSLVTFPYLQFTLNAFRPQVLWEVSCVRKMFPSKHCSATVFFLFASVEIQYYCSQLLWRSKVFVVDSGHVGLLLKKQARGFGVGGGNGQRVKERAEDGVIICSCARAQMQLASMWVL